MITVSNINEVTLMFMTHVMFMTGSCHSYVDLQIKCYHILLKSQRHVQKIATQVI